MDTEQIERRLERVAEIFARNLELGAKLIVRGHADRSEPEPEALGRRRAEFVVDALAAISRRKREAFEIRSYGASLPIVSDPSEAAQNRRVDFEVVRASQANPR